MKATLVWLFCVFGLIGSVWGNGLIEKGDQSDRAKSVTSDKPQRQEERRGDWQAYLVKELNLSKDQAEEVAKIKAKYDADLKKMKKEMTSLRRDLLSMSKQPDKGEDFNKKLNAKHDEAQKARNAYDNKRFEMMLEARSVLEPEQIANLDDVIQRKWKYHRWKHNKKRDRKSKQAQECLKTSDGVCQ